MAKWILTSKIKGWGIFAQSITFFDKKPILKQLEKVVFDPIVAKALLKSNLATKGITTFHLKKVRK
jgi:hypothetical protein